MCGISTWEEHTGELIWKVLGWRGLSEVIFAQAVLHRTVFYRNYGKIQCDNYGSMPFFSKYDLDRINHNCTVPYNSTSPINPHCPTLPMSLL
jgi:hypothetical protein